jgi:Predicted transcriptional regulator
MPQNKDQLLRYKVLDECFRNTSRLYNMRALLDAVNLAMDEVYCKQVSLRTVQTDVQKMQYSPFCVEFDESLLKSGYYRYADTDFKLELVQSLTERERTAVRETVELLKPIIDDIEDSTPLQQYMYLCLQQLAGGDSLSFEFPSVAFENNDALAGIGYFSELAKAIMNRQPLLIAYRSFRSGKTREQKIHPYLLKQFNGRWYLIAATQGFDGIGPYALDRIKDVKLWNAKFQPAETDINDYFRHTIGVTVDNSLVERIVLRINNNRYPYIETKPFCDEQRIVAHDDCFHTIAFPMRINQELVSELLSFGDDLEVVEPQSLKKLMAEKIDAMQKKYSDAQKDCAE